MNTHEIDAALKNCQITRRCFVGTFPCDKIPQCYPNASPKAWVFNVDNSDMPGRHWVAAFFDNREVLYFDSCAEEPVNEIALFLQQFPRISRMPFRVQDYLSDLCGQYCVHFIVSLCSGKSFTQFLKTFSRVNLGKNDNFIKMWVVGFLRRNLSRPLTDLSIKDLTVRSPLSLSSP